MDRSEKNKRKFNAEYGGNELTESGKEKSAALDRLIAEVEKNLAEAEDCATLARVEVMNTEQRLGEWIKSRRQEIEAGKADMSAIEKNTGEDAASARD